MMRAAVIRDEQVYVEERAKPSVGSGEVLVRVRAAGINGADILQRRGRYPAPPGVPADIPGLELAGEVAQTGPGAERFAVGDRVMGIVGGGGQAEFAVVHERQLMPVPPAISWPEAGGLAEIFTTAHDALVVQAGLTAGDRLLINGAAGGVGTAAVQIGALIGAEVVASVRRPEQHAAVAELGATAVITPAEVSEQAPFDVVLELVGAPNLAADVAALAIGGRIVVIGIGAGAKAELNLALLLARGGRILASTLRARPLEQKAQTARAVEHSLLGAFTAGRLKVPIAASYPLAAAAAAYERFTAGGKIGKIVLLN